VRQVQAQRGSSRAAQRRRDAEHDEPMTVPGDPRDPDLGDEVEATLDAIDAALEADQ